MKSILQSEKECYICGAKTNLECHHIFAGNPLRKISEQNGFKVYLCRLCHNEPPNGVHFNRKNMDALKAECQRKFEETHTRKEFMKLIGRNYL